MRAAWYTRKLMHPPILYKRLYTALITFLKQAIVLYQLISRTWLMPRCRFYPTCSQYALEAIEKRGLWYGSLLSVQRLLKCHPWHPGGVDLVPSFSKSEARHCSCPKS